MKNNRINFRSAVSAATAVALAWACGGVQPTETVANDAEEDTPFGGVPFSVMEHEPRVALVIGNEKYNKVRPLNKPVEDAKNMIATLKSLGFDVIDEDDCCNLTRIEMLQKIGEFKRRLKAGGVALFYYAGHGIQMDGKNYLIPVEANLSPEQEELVDEYTVSTKRIMESLRGANSRVNIVILDACRDNPFEGKFYSTADRGLALETHKPKDTYVVYATQEGKRASDESGFSSALAKYMKKPGASFSDVVMETTREVLKNTNETQEVGIYGTASTPFYFILPEKPKPQVTCGERTVLKDGVCVGNSPEVGHMAVEEGEDNGVEQDESGESAERGAAKVSVQEVGDGEPRKNAQDVDWVQIEGGRFKMGGSDGADDEKPPHWVTVLSFEMLRTEVTVDQYKACSGCSKPGDKDDNEYCNWGNSKRGRNPINCVDWVQADAYCRSIGGRLPSEAEWEYAARSRGKDRKYPWGNETANCDYAIMYGSGGEGCGSNQTWFVCSRKKGNTAEGLCDMAGNVWEWTEDWYHDSYNGAPIDGSAWVSGGGESRVLRGGSWSNDYGDSLRASNRYRATPPYRDCYLGFRCVRSSH